MAEELIVVANLIWEYNNKVISDPIDLGALEHLAVSSDFDITIRHDSNQEILECGFYISPFTGEYVGSASADKDYERVLWFTNNYPGHGLSVRQQYSVTGTIDRHDGVRVLDFERDERVDIFAGEQLEIVSGPALGQSVIIESYNPLNQLFIIGGDFSEDVAGANYKIDIDKETFFKTHEGDVITDSIPLIYKSGSIERLDQAVVQLKLRIPKFAQTSGNFLFDFNMKFTSLEE